MIVLVTDSTAYFTKAEAAALGVVMVPMTYTQEGRTVYTEGYIDEDAAYLTSIAKNIGRYATAQASLSAFWSTFEDILAQGNQVLCITISSRFSGTYANAMKAAQEIGGTDIEVVDSKTTAGAMYLLLKKARQFLDDGMTLVQAALKLREEREKAKTYFSVEDMGPLRRSGRLGFVRMSVSTVLNIRPVLKNTDGGVTTHALARGKHDQLRVLEQTIKNYQPPVIVQYCGVDGLADALVKRLQAKGIPVLRRLIGPVLAIHLGLTCISITWLES